MPEVGFRIWILQETFLLVESKTLVTMAVLLAPSTLVGPSAIATVDIAGSSTGPAAPTSVSACPSTAAMDVLLSSASITCRFFSYTPSAVLPTLPPILLILLLHPLASHAPLFARGFSHPCSTLHADVRSPVLPPQADVRRMSAVAFLSPPLLLTMCNNASRFLLTWTTLSP